MVVQGGLHHFPELPADLELTLAEIRHVLRPGGLAVIVEPWLTSFCDSSTACVEFDWREMPGQNWIIWRS